VAKYSIRIKKTARKELEAINTKADRLRIVKRIQSLASDPRPIGARKLSGRERYRIRQGRYRILYTIEDAVLTVYVIKVGQRKDVYRAKT
jgi:mRNA interferase RelE/StbE